MVYMIAKRRTLINKNLHCSTSLNSEVIRGGLLLGQRERSIALVLPTIRLILFCSHHRLSQSIVWMILESLEVAYRFEQVISPAYIVTPVLGGVYGLIKASQSRRLARVPGDTRTAK